MDLIYGFAVILVIFDGIIIQCDDSTNPKQKIAHNVIKEDQPILPHDLIESIISKTDFETLHGAIREYVVSPNSIVMSRILRDCIIVIMPERDGGINHEIESGDSFLSFGSYKSLESFFDKFGDQVKKIQIYVTDGCDIEREIIIQNIFKTYAKNLEELRISTNDDVGFWNEILNGKNAITFPKVKKFQIKGESCQNELKLNSIFPKLESFKLFGPVADVNCLANVNGLNELVLDSELIEEDQLKDIFKNNQNIKMIYLFMPQMTETMESIAKYLKKLKIFEVDNPGENFLLRSNNSQVFKFPSITQFSIIFIEMNEIFGARDLSFDMPHLKKLTLDGYDADDRIVNFIQHFKELEIVEVSVTKYNGLHFIEKLKHIKEFTTTFCEDDFDSLKNFFEDFDKKSKLQTVKLLDFNESIYGEYERNIIELNVNLKKSMKPTWTLSHGELIDLDQKYLMLKRDPCT